MHIKFVRMKRVSLKQDDPQNPPQRCFFFFIKWYHNRGKEVEIVYFIGKYPWSFVKQIFHDGQPYHDGSVHNSLKELTLSLPRKTIGSISYMYKAVIYQINLEIYILVINLRAILECWNGTFAIRFSVCLMYVSKVCDKQ